MLAALVIRARGRHQLRCTRLLTSGRERASDVAPSVHPPGDVEEVDRNTAEHNSLPPAAIAPLEQRCGRVPERTREVERHNLATTLATNSRPQRSHRNAKMQRTEPARAHPPVGMVTDVGGKLTSRHPLGRDEIASSDHEPEQRSQRKKHPPCHAGQTTRSTTTASGSCGLSADSSVRAPMRSRAGARSATGASVLDRAPLADRAVSIERVKRGDSTNVTAIGDTSRPANPEQHERSPGAR